MLEEHGLISVGTVQHVSLPEGAKLFLTVDGILRRVKKIIETSKGIRALVQMPTGTRRIPVNQDTLLVIAYYDLAMELAEPIIKQGRLVRLPLKEHKPVEIHPSNYAGIYAG